MFMGTILEVKNLCKVLARVNSVSVLSGVSLKVQKETVAILGQSGVENNLAFATLVWMCLIKVR